MKTTNLLRRELTTRLLFFFVLGILCGLYFFLSFPFFDKISVFNNKLRPVLMFFGIFYPLSYLILLYFGSLGKDFFKLIKKILKIKSKEINEINEIRNGSEHGFKMAADVFMYYTGAFIGWCIFLLFGTIALVGYGLFFLIKFISNWGFLWLIYF